MQGLPANFRIPNREKPQGNLKGIKEETRQATRVFSDDQYKETIMAKLSLIDAAKAPVLAFGDKNWDGVRASVAPGILYDEVAIPRKMKGTDQLLACWQGWATAFPDSKATFLNAIAGGNTVALEMKWRGTHRGVLQTPEGRFDPTGKTIEVPACLVVEIEDGKAKSMRHYFDMATLFQQLGLAKAA